MTPGRGAVEIEKRKCTITATGVEPCLDDHVGDEARGLAGLVQQSSYLGLGGNVAVWLELGPYLCRRLRQHQQVPGESLPDGSQQRSVRSQCFSSHHFASPSPGPVAATIGFSALVLGQTARRRPNRFSHFLSLIFLWCFNPTTSKIFQIRKKGQ